MISTGTLRTPDGKGVADRPSRPGRAPAPPEWKVVTMNGRLLPIVPVMPWPAPSFRFQRLQVPSAGTPAGQRLVQRVVADVGQHVADRASAR